MALSSDSSLGEENFNPNSQILDHENNVGKRMRRRWVYPSSLCLLSDQHHEYYRGCGRIQITCVEPFNLRTEQRGHLKEQEFTKKLQEMMAQEAKLRIPMAQGLPLTTDEPQVLPKPPVRGQTKPLNIKLHSETRAVERTRFDHLIAQKIYFLEQRRQEEERIQELVEMEEIERMRRTMIPRAQMMPFFDGPFIPKRSTKALTVPREPKFNMPRRQNVKSKNVVLASRQE